MHLFALGALHDVGVAVPLVVYVAGILGGEAKVAAAAAINGVGFDLTVFPGSDDFHGSVC
jgi:hypothetical protein